MTLAGGAAQDVKPKHAGRKLAAKLFAAAIFLGSVANAHSAPQKTAVLYEESPTNPNGLHFVGTARWQTDPSTAVAVVEIPARRLKMTLTIERNVDLAVSASHAVTFEFARDPDPRSPQVREVPGLLTKHAEGARGEPLAGVSRRASDGRFVLALSERWDDIKRNLMLLRDRDWLDVPIVYANGRRAVLAVFTGGTFGGAAASLLDVSAARARVCELLGRPSIGMLRTEAEKTCWGSPTRVSKTTRPDGIQEDLFYSHGRLTFQAGKLSEIHETE